MSLGHEHLDAYTVARQLAVDLYRISQDFPAEEKFGLTSQIRRAAVSIPANVAEGAARKSKKEFARFLAIARGSSAELRVLLEIADQIGFLTKERSELLFPRLDRISAMLSGLIRQADDR
ncbi:MAG: four helix bundle protein [Acidobacteriota bacterium]